MQMSTYFVIAIKLSRSSLGTFVYVLVYEDNITYYGLVTLYGRYNIE